jgi:hypothetical protein
MTFFVLNRGLELVTSRSTYASACTAAVARACDEQDKFHVASRIDGGDEWAEDVPLRWHLHVTGGEQP